MMLVECANTVMIAHSNQMIIQIVLRMNYMNNPEQIKCFRCKFRHLNMRNKQCQMCIFYPNFPNFEEDVRLTNSKLELFGVS